jgi:hypothetical protein
MKIVGSITPYGDVPFAFYSDENITDGYGTFRKINSEWKFIMQMNSLGIIGLSHWSKDRDKRSLIPRLRSKLKALLGSGFKL